MPDETEAKTGDRHGMFERGGGCVRRNKESGKFLFADLLPIYCRFIADL